MPVICISPLPKNDPACLYVFHGRLMLSVVYNVDVHGRRVAASQLPQAANGTTCYDALLAFSEPSPSLKGIIESIA